MGGSEPAFSLTRSQVAALHRLATLASAQASFERVVSDMLGIVPSIVGSSDAVLYLYERNRDVVVEYTRQGQGMQKRAAEAGLVSRVLLTGDAEVSSTAMAAPLAARRRLGVLVAFGEEGRPLAEPDLNLLSLVADQVALLVENIQLRGVLEPQSQQLEALTRLEEATRRRDEFVSVLAHELRNPMSSLMGFGQQLQRQWDSVSDEQREKILNYITSEIARLSRLVSDVLDVGRMESGALAYSFEPVAIEEEIENVLAQYPSLQESHQVEAQVAPELPPVRADRDRLRQALLNLLTNATRYSPEGSRVVVSATMADGLPATATAGSDDGQAPDAARAVVISVTDEGIGIAQPDQDRLFSKFPRISKPDWVPKGTGLGLFITKAIVDAHGGRIWCMSAPDEGSTFSFTLPAA